MKERLIHLWFKMKGKYILAFALFLSWIFFFDEHNLIQHYRNRQKLEQLKARQEYYIQKIEADKRKLYELQTNDENLEKFAREQFQMKKENEDVFVIVEEKK